MKKLSSINYAKHCINYEQTLIKENEMTDIKANGNGICFINNWVPLLIHEMRRCNPTAKVCFKYQHARRTEYKNL